MTLCIDGTVNLDLSGNPKLSLSPHSKCALLFCLYPNKWKTLKIIVSVEDENYDATVSACEIRQLWNIDLDICVQPMSQIATELTSVSFPALYLPDSCLIICGFTSVIRALVLKISKEDLVNDNAKLLGRNQSCLKACKETSKWAMFCEVSVPNSLVKAMTDLDYSCSTAIFSELSESFRIHVQLHNRNKLKLNSKHSDNLRPYLESFQKTLVDVVCGFFILQASNDCSTIATRFNQYSLLCEWIKRLTSDSIFHEAFSQLSEVPVIWCSPSDSINQNESHVSSLIKGIEKLEVTAKNVTDLNEAVSFVEKCGLELTCQDNENIFENWEKVLSCLHPSESGIPTNRLAAKRQQLENLVTCIVKIAKPGDYVVDFCSGSGHLGLVLACLLPECKIILLDNKEESLMRAEKRIGESGLNNIYFYKGNLVNYRGPIDVGAALHACGASTDLVMEMCFAKQCRGFVISPCCYGSIKPNKNIIYPRSELFRSQISLDIYSKLCHSADMFDPTRSHHQELAYRAMNIVDSDRVYFARNKGYKTGILKMVPRSCTPKNNVIVGSLP